MHQITRLENLHELNVSALAFSADGNWVVSVGGDDNHTVIVTDWESGSRIAIGRGGGNDIHGIRFNPHPEHQLELVQTGAKHSRFWQIDGSSLEIIGPERYKVTESTYATAFMENGSSVVGQDDGSLYQVRVFPVIRDPYRARDRQGKARAEQRAGA